MVQDDAATPRVAQIVPVLPSPQSKTLNTAGIHVSPASRLSIGLPSLVYPVVWWLIAGLHVWCAAHLGALMFLYWYVDHPYLTYFADLLAPKSSRHFHLFGAIFGILAGFHALCILELIVLSLMDRRLVLSWNDLHNHRRPSLRKKIVSTRTKKGKVHAQCDVSAMTPQHVRTARSYISVSHQSVRSLWNTVTKLFSRTGLFGVESEFFGFIFALREVIEVASQTYQAYFSSRMVAKNWLNRLLVLLVAINCWTTPIFQRLLRDKPAAERTCCIIADVALNMATNMLIPFIMFRPYLLVWDAQWYTFDLSLLYEDVWFVTLVLENRVLFALSGVDFVSKFVPHLSILVCLGSVKGLIARASVVASTAVHPTYPPRAVMTNSSTRSVMRQSFELGRRISHGLLGFSTTHCPESIRMNGWKTTVLHVTFLVWGFALLGFHIFAEHIGQSPMPGCKQTVRPWFSRRPACANYEYNCYRLQDRLSVSDAMNQLDPDSVFGIIFSHCRELVVPTHIQKFSSLLGIELYNTTLREWSSSAAISASVHSSMVYLMLVFVNMTNLPDGILGPLPDMLTDIEIAYTNLTTLPDNLHELWHPMAALYFEFSQVHVFPITLTQLEVFDLSLIGNYIESVDGAIDALPFEYYTLALSKNPIRELPKSLMDGASFGFLGLEQTAIAKLPAWIDERVQEHAYFGGSPYCEDRQHITTGIAVCGDADPRGDGRYPLSIMLPRRIP